ncbi:hypothetical protein [Extensimonas sp. H3M7-6]|jgi:hypothetical protein|uniref:hypothetical protein n=1 Tax=Extensimonas soli TaxID=3031322 RepID=UPI0023DC4A5A|nr:hypothetical protein [Extensimonas sp. H3M7-6]MDF1481442.1 hypothetical protein [Extensimonas sp. H3M7-6]
MSERALIVRHALTVLVGQWAPQPSPLTFWATSALALALVAALFLALLRRALNGRAQAARPDANGLPER